MHRWTVLTSYGILHEILALFGSLDSAIEYAAFVSDNWFSFLRVEGYGGDYLTFVIEGDFLNE